MTKKELQEQILSLKEEMVSSKKITEAEQQKISMEMSLLSVEYREEKEKFSDRTKRYAAYKERISQLTGDKKDYRASIVESNIYRSMNDPLKAKAI